MKLSKPGVQTYLTPGVDFTTDKIDLVSLEINKEDYSMDFEY